jgi:hypothetical protein
LNDRRGLDDGLGLGYRLRLGLWFGIRCRQRWGSGTGFGLLNIERSGRGNHGLPVDQHPRGSVGTILIYMRLAGALLHALLSGGLICIGCSGTAISAAMPHQVALPDRRIKWLS